MSFAKVVKQLMGTEHTGRAGDQRMMGGMIAIVTNNVDPEDRYRVKVKFPWLDDKEESFWARIGTTMSHADETGSFWLPEVDDEVLVLFQEGDFERPVLVSQLYNGKDKSPRKIKYSPTGQIEEPVPNNQQGGKNDFRFFRSRMHHHLLFQDRDGEGAISLRTKKSHELFLDDKAGEEKIQLYDMEQKQWLEIDVPNMKITLQTDTGDIHIKAEKNIFMEAGKNIEMKAGVDIIVKSGAHSKWNAGGTIKWHSGGTSDYTAAGNMKLKAPKIDLNP